MTLLTRELVSRLQLCVVSVFTDIVKDCSKIRNLPPKIFLRSFERVLLTVTTIPNQPKIQSSPHSHLFCVIYCCLNMLFYNRSVFIYSTVAGSKCEIKHGCNCQYVSINQYQPLQLQSA